MTPYGDVFSSSPLLCLAVRFLPSLLLATSSTDQSRLSETRPAAT